MKREYEDMQEGFKQNQQFDKDYKVADLNLAELGRKSITIAEHGSSNNLHNLIRFIKIHIL